MKGFKFEYRKFGLLVGLVCLFCGCTESGDQEKNTSIPNPSTQAVEEERSDSVVLFKPFEIQDSSRIQVYPSGLKIYLVEKGSGVIPKPGETVIAHYHGMLEDGRVFDSSFERNEPFQFVLGQGQVIKGWDEAFQKLPVGSKAILIIPPELGYGDQQVGPIPPNSTLIFHVEVLGTVPLAQ